MTSKKFFYIFSKVKCETMVRLSFRSIMRGNCIFRHITGLCDGQQRRLLETIALSRRAGYMPVFIKDPKYLRDPKLFDPLKPIRPHSYA